MPLPLPRRRVPRVLLLLLVAALLVAAASVLTSRLTAPASVAERDAVLPGAPGANGQPVALDTTTYLPEDLPAPAVLLAHGLGGSKDTVRTQALALARRGYVVLTWSARGFGASTGQVSLDAPDGEVADASRLLDALAADPDEVVQDGDGDPRAGVAGGSYGGALALLLAGTDQRVDAVDADITWNDLGSALVPQSADGGSAGVLKSGWAGRLFATGLGPGSRELALDPSCGRFAADVCAAWQQLSTDGAPDAATSALLAARSPASVLADVHAPVLLTQGEADSLFGLGQTDATARALRRAGTTVKVVWHTGGHDGGSPEAVRLGSLVADWFDQHLRHGDAVDDDFEVSLPAPLGDPQLLTTGRAYGDDATSTTMTLSGPPQRVAAPAGGTPAALTSLPGLPVSLASSLLGTASALPGQVAAFTTGRLTDPLTVLGAGTVRLAVTSTAPEATLFVSLVDVAAGSPAGELPEGLVAPVHLTGLTADGSPQVVTVTLPAIARTVESGHRLRLVVSTTDSGYALPDAPAVHQIALAAPDLVLPTPATTALAGPRDVPVAGLVAAGLALLVALALVLTGRRRRVHAGGVDPDLVDVPLRVEGLHKAYRGGFVAVEDVSFTVGRGQVVGLLGPNGAGKTTTLRMLMGLLVPTSGTLRVFGHTVVPGAPVLSRLGAFVEGPGFLPHLSGRRNLELYWRSTGRPEADAGYDRVLEVAGLGDAVERTVRTYSQGMRQRLAIAQAMLGLPDLLVLDEPTNGLDPPQIRAMREVLRAYASEGRTVLVSSHLLAEVEQTCTHAVVVHHGRVVASGTVAELVGASGSLRLSVDDVDAARRVLAAVPGLGSVVEDPDGPDALDVEPGDALPEDVVRALVAGGVGVRSLAPRRRLEDVFLDLVAAP